MKLVFIGPAGSGKTTLVWKFGNYLERLGYEISRINLDCAVENLPYKASFDIRDFFTLSDIMRKFNLGPNGALMKSVELIFRYRKEIEKHFDKDFILVDTPGQLELSLFHKKKLTDIFSERGICIFLIPADLIRSSKDYYFLRLLEIAVRYRVNMPCIYTISKADLIKKFPKLKRFRDDLSEVIYEVLRKVEHSQRIINLSMYGKGFEELLSMVYESFCICGDLG